MKKLLLTGGVATCIIIGFISMFGLTASAQEDTSTTSTTVAPYEPPVRGPQEPEEPYPDPCIVDGVRYDEWVSVAWPNNEGTTEWGFLPCSRVTVPVVETTPVTVAPQQEVETPTTLPSTGPSEHAPAILGWGWAAIGWGWALILMVRARV